MAKPQGVNCDLPKNNNNEDNNQSQYIYNLQKVMSLNQAILFKLWQISISKVLKQGPKTISNNTTKF